MMRVGKVNRYLDLINDVCYTADRSRLDNRTAHCVVRKVRAPQGRVPGNAWEV